MGPGNFIRSYNSKLIMISNHRLFERLIFLFATMVIITILLVVLSGFLSAFDKDVDLAMQQRVQEWIAPVGEAYTKDNPPPQQEGQKTDDTIAASADPADSSHPASSSEGSGGDPALQAKQTYESTCAACHATGLLNAPKFGDAAIWKKLLSDQGLDALYHAALHGKGMMPAKGGNPTLSDAVVKSTVDYMLKHSGGTP